MMEIVKVVATVVVMEVVAVAELISLALIQDEIEQTLVFSVDHTERATIPAIIAQTSTQGIKLRPRLIIV